MDTDPTSFNPKQFDGGYYAAIGDHLGERYLDYGFTKGTVGEVDFLVNQLQLKPGATRILDVGCGVGRHSLELARRGFSVVGVDISAKFIELANEAAKREKLSAHFVTQDARHLAFENEFDAAICLCEGAFGLAGSDEAHLAILRGIAKALKSGAKFVLTAINAYHVVGKASPNFDVYTCTSRDIDTITNSAGEKREVEIYTSAFTYRELKLMLTTSGFEIEAAYGCEAGKFHAKQFEVTDTEIMMIAHRSR